MPSNKSLKGANKSTVELMGLSNCAISSFHEEYFLSLPLYCTQKLLVPFRNFFGDENLRAIGTQILCDKR